MIQEADTACGGQREISGEPGGWYSMWWPASEVRGEPGGDTECGGQLVRYLVSQEVVLSVVVS